ncbi:MAG: carboxymuconolactone decarboxylase family protein [Anaerolineae bacterium]
MHKDKLVRSYREFSGPIFADGALRRKDKELIAMAVALVTASKGCYEEHRAYAVREGATEEEITETIGVVMSMLACSAVASTTDLFG